MLSQATVHLRFKITKMHSGLLSISFSYHQSHPFLKESNLTRAEGKSSAKLPSEQPAAFSAAKGPNNDMLVTSLQHFPICLGILP